MLEKSKEPWQVNQARDSISLFVFYVGRFRHTQKNHTTHSLASWKCAKDHIVMMIRLRQLSIQTERTYLSWIYSFCRLTNGCSPDALDGVHVKHFLTYLAAERRVSASTQNQDFNAIFFFYRYVLDKDIGDLANVVQARGKRRLPVVLTRSEINYLIEKLSGINQLMARLIFGAGLRLAEC